MEGGGGGLVAARGFVGGGTGALGGGGERVGADGKDEMGWRGSKGGIGCWLMVLGNGLPKRLVPPYG